MKRPRNSALRRGLRRLTDPSLLGWPFFWASLLAWFVSFYPQVFRSEFSMSWPLVYGWTVSIAGGQLVMFALLLIAKVLWWRRPFTARHPAIAVWSLIVGSTLGVITASTIANQLPAAEQGLTFGFEHVFFGVIGLMIIGSTIVALGNYKDDVDLLEDRQGALRATLEQGRITLQDERQATEQTVMSVMTEARSALEGESREAADRLSAASEHVLRPLSHELASARHGFVPVDVATPRPRWRSVLTEVSTAPLVAPRMTALIMLLFAWRISYEPAVNQPAQVGIDAPGGTVGVSVDLSSFVSSLLELLSVFFGTLIAAWFVVIASRGLLTWLRPVGRWVVAIVSAVAVAIGSQLIIGVLFSVLGLQTMVDRNILVRLLVIIPIATVSIIMGIVRAADIAQRDVKEQLDQTNTDLAWQVARINQEIWDQRRALALIVHGPLRAALISSAMQLARPTRESAASLAAELGERIQRATEEFVSPEDARDPLASLAGLQELWSGTCTISLSVDDASTAALASDPIAAHTANRVIEEACANAITHGHASVIDVRVTVRDDELDITVTNDGTPPGEHSGNGLGTTFIDEVSTEWRLVPDMTGTLFSAAIPTTSSIHLHT